MSSASERQQATQPAVNGPGRSAVIAAVIGNALEWYDFTVFSFMVVVIAELFFPSSSEYASLLLTTATFGVAFFMRPIGGIVLGLYADRAGRKAALSLVILLMTAGIFLIAAAPTYAAIGIGAPLLIVFGRLLQGFSAGGEFGSATAMLIEAAPRGRRGFYGSWQMSSQSAALLVGALVGTLVTHGLSSEALHAWGWRVPFLLGLLIGPIGYYLRRHLADSEVFLASKASARRVTLGEVFAQHGREVLCGLGSVIALTVTIYVLISYLPTFAVKQLKLPYAESFYAVIVGGLLLTVLTPLAGAWSDRIGRKTLSLWSLVATLVLIYPLFLWLDAAPSVGRLVLVQGLLAITLSGYYGPFGAMIAELFPAQVRSTGLSLAYNVAVMLFGGFGQFIVTWLIKATGTPLAPTYYVMAGLALSVIAVAC
ncbi:MFS transporter, partial [Burkholderia gladioli]